MSVNKSKLSIDYASTSIWLFVFAHPDLGFAENIESADYLQPGDVGFKKPKVRLTSTYGTGTFDADNVRRPRRSVPHVVSTLKSPTFRL